MPHSVLPPLRMFSSDSLSLSVSLCVCVCVCARVCVRVCVCVQNKKLWTDFDEIFWRVRAWPTGPANNRLDFGCDLMTPSISSF